MVRGGGTWGFHGYSVQEPGLSRFRSVVVITFASHAKGPRFETGRKHGLLFHFILFFFYFSILVTIFLASWSEDRHIKNVCECVCVCVCVCVYVYLYFCFSETGSEAEL